MTQNRPLQALILIICAGCWGCDAAPDTGSSRRAVAASDAVVDAVVDAVKDAPVVDATTADLPSVEQGGADLQPGADLSLCGAVTAQGCCDGETLWWCVSGALKSEHCGTKPSCGWNTTGIYDCNTSGAADPTGVHARECAAGDSGVPPSDLGGDGATKPCAGVPLEGCCAGSTLRYCEDGALKVLSCAFNLSCGWFNQGKYYDCGTAGSADPSGVHPQACAGVTPADSGPDRGSDTTPAADLGGDSGVAPNGCGSCRVRAGEDGSLDGARLGGALWMGLLAALLLVLRRRASS
jgi:hypothetical protein